jgi:hypothetical protein
MLLGLGRFCSMSMNIDCGPLVTWTSILPETTGAAISPRHSAWAHKHRNDVILIFHLAHISICEWLSRGSEWWLSKWPKDAESEWVRVRKSVWEWMRLSEGEWARVRVSEWVNEWMSYRVIEEEAWASESEQVRVKKWEWASESERVSVSEWES